jgi:hypothetical protein
VVPVTQIFFETKREGAVDRHPRVFIGERTRAAKDLEFVRN